MSIQRSNEWGKDIADAEKIGNYYEVSTTALDHNNDFIQFYIRQDGNRFLFSDDGDTLSALESEGVFLSQKVREGIAETLHQYDAKLEGDALTAESSVAEYPQTKKKFIQAMMKVDGLSDKL